MSTRFESLSGVILTLIKQLNLQNEMDIYHLCEHWEEIAGPQIALHTVPEKLRFNRLTLSVDSAPWMNQLTFFKKEIIEKINRFLQKQIVHELFFKLTPLPASSKKNEVFNFGIENTKAPMMKEEASVLEEALKGLQSAEMRKQIETAIAGYFKK
jgi:predicted nucleic acid-binding Zn ribbon protein